MKYCPCGIYRQLDSILQPSYHIPKPTQLVFNRLVINYF